MARSTSRSIEEQLVRQKAEILSNGQLADEIQRCRRGIQVAANKAARDRFERRLAIMESEANGRMANAGGGR